MRPNSPLSDIGPQPRLVDVPVAVFAAVEQDHRQPIPEFGTQRLISGGSSGVDVGFGEVEAQFAGQNRQPIMDPAADSAARTGQQLDMSALHGRSVCQPADRLDVMGSGDQARAGDASALRAIEDLPVEELGAEEAAVPLDLTAAAFFDVDNTLVQGSSLVHFGRGLAARKYFRYGDVWKFIYAQAKFQLTGRENSDDVAEGRRKALAFIEGRSVDELSALCEEIYDEIIAGKIWAGTRAMAQMHLDAGQQVWLVTATPYDLAEIIARRLGLTGALGTVAESVDGVFTGRLVGDILHGPGKAHAVRALAVREGLNLKRCTAYSDSINDVPMLSLVGTAVAVNPDSDLRDVARERGWEIKDFRTARKAAKIGVPSALAITAVGGALAAAASRRNDNA